MTFLEIKRDLKEYCHEHETCTDGYSDLLQAETPAAMWAIMKEHIIGMQSDRWCQHVAEHLKEWYDAFGDDARKQGIYVNENVRGAMVLVNNQDDFIADEDADYYVFGRTKITAIGAARVHCQIKEAEVVLDGYGKSEVSNSRVLINGRSTATVTDCQMAECRESATVLLMSGTLIDHGHLSITAYNGSVVYSISTKKIALVAGATIKLLEE